MSFLYFSSRTNFLSENCRWVPFPIPSRNLPTLLYILPSMVSYSTHLPTRSLFRIRLVLQPDNIKMNNNAEIEGVIFIILIL